MRMGSMRPLDEEIREVLKGEMGSGTWMGSPEKHYLYHDLSPSCP